ncbi:WYL domain-containing protein [Inconstantimicrobium mannanitabidum]|uniref:Uncharacterized protein n=1 Tax=Inconstantimicrobium mannanitabidum TaxID=1604901 RepID=A0ACB5REY4_9CLOT|nr:WYL domain-containing protein [Clostridium sp. TW13]GKX67633.1 hypothetical protein rsdtw13_28910 [Clostridium sp. TW13]
MSLKERNINKILEQFKKNSKLTLNDIQILLDVKERNAKNYIRYLKEYGFNINCEKGIYSLGSIDESQAKVIDKDVIREIEILTIVGINDGIFNRKQLVNEIRNSFCDEEAVSEKTLIRAIKKCEDKKIIKLEDEKYRLLLNISNLYSISYEDISKFVDKCEAYNTSTPFFIQTKKLKEKVAVQCDYKGWEYSVFSLGREYQRNNFKNFFEKINKYDYKHKKLKIEYKSQIGSLCAIIEVCTFYYSWDKDKIYIICKNGGNTILINTDTITDIQEIEEKNYFFKDKEVVDKVKLMFQASLSTPYKVKVEFDNVFNINDKLQRLSKSRYNSKLIALDNKLIYEDEICGLYDFANYLRRFGYSCRVIEPVELKNIMKNTYERILENYGVNSDE